jgi:predicted DCC family thiol-disulfide oxidoreductase YuxK
VSTLTLSSSTPRASIVLFDGVCNLCDHATTFVLDHDRRGRFLIASLQSEEGGAVLDAVGLPRPTPGADPDSMVLVEGGRAYERSAAVLRIAIGLGWPWKLAGIFLLLPSFLRDPIYRYIARKRYAWFGKKETCRVPTPELRDRFLSSHPEQIPSAPSPSRRPDLKPA